MSNEDLKLPLANVLCLAFDERQTTDAIASHVRNRARLEGGFFVFHNSAHIIRYGGHLGINNY